ncbi:type VI secretion system baseplate subunit TssG [Spirosoma litoris]
MSVSDPSAVSSPYFLDLLDVDFKAEILAASLANQQMAPERIIVNPTGLYSRAYSKDIEDVSDWLLEGSTFIYNRIDTPREGLFDMLPHYLFFSPAESTGPENVDQLLDGIRRDREEERQARLFFLPFDAELNHLRTLSVHYDSSVDHLDGATEIIKQFAEHWPIINAMSRSQAGIFIQILPWLHLLRSNLPWFGRFLHLFFGVPAQVEAGRRLDESTREGGLPRLDNCRLGIDTVVSDHFDADWNGIRISIGPVPDNRVADFLPHSKTIALLHNLIDYFLPVSSEVSISVLTKPGAPKTADTFLGYNSFL